ncbi:MAG: 4Fe-4S binding protein [Deltaproteobacteria bacterium]|nr:MAG: 4Fe-4S binding protein [Deltaproteobacteria bacterium]
MSERLLLIDVDKCVGCYACEIACKQEHHLPLEPRWCTVIPIGPRKLGEKLHLDFVPALCIHCDDPLCSYFCPVDAISKRQDGIVVIDEDECTGCRLCVYGCPYGAIYFDHERKIAGKCSLCVSRIDDGLEPSCVQHCIGGALLFVTEEELGQITEGMHTARDGKVCYTSSKWKLPLMRKGGRCC